MTLMIVNLLICVVLCEIVMKVIDDKDNLLKYIYNLERENASLKRSHSYRVGKSLIDIKNTIKKKDLIGLHPTAKSFLQATKKIKSSPKHIKIDLEKIIEGGSILPSISERKNEHMGKNDINHYFIPKIKYSEVMGVFSENECSSDFHILISPYNYQEVIEKSGIDIIVFDLKSISNSILWFSLGTYEAIELLRRLTNALKKNKKIITVLIENDNIKLFPLFLDLKNQGFFDFIRESNK